MLASTDRDLTSVIRQGLFREDLCYRLITITLDLPQLRERRSDVDLLATHVATVPDDRIGFRRRTGDGAGDVLRR